MIPAIADSNRALIVRVLRAGILHLHRLAALRFEVNTDRPPPAPPITRPWYPRRSTCCRKASPPEP